MSNEKIDEVEPDETHLPVDYVNVVDEDDADVEVSENQSPEPDAEGGDE